MGTGKRWRFLTCHVTEISQALRGASSLTTKPDTALAACSMASWKHMKSSRNVAHKDSLHHCKDKFCWCHLCHVTSLRHVCAYQVCACGMHITHVCELRVCGQVCVCNMRMYASYTWYVCDMYVTNVCCICAAWRQYAVIMFTRGGLILYHLCVVSPGGVSHACVALWRTWVVPCDAKWCNLTWCDWMRDNIEI